MSRQLPEHQQEGPIGKRPHERGTTQTPVGKPWLARTSLIRQLTGFQLGEPGGPRPARLNLPEFQLPGPNGPGTPRVGNYLNTSGKTLVGQGLNKWAAT